MDGRQGNEKQRVQFYKRYIQISLIHLTKRLHKILSHPWITYSPLRYSIEADLEHLMTSQLIVLSSSRWNRPAVEPPQGSHRSRSRPTQVCEAGPTPLRASAGAMLRDPQEEHPEIQQLHLPHRVTSRPLWAPPAGVGSISIRVLVRGWEEVRMWGYRTRVLHPQWQAAHLLPFLIFLIFFFLFARFFLWSCALWLDLCCHVALCQKQHAGVWNGSEDLDHLTVRESCMQVCQPCVMHASRTAFALPWNYEGYGWIQEIRRK